MALQKSHFTEKSQNIARALVEESDRGCVLAAHGRIDKGLEELLRRRLRNKADSTKKLIGWLLSDGQQPPLQSYYMKMVTARVLLLIDADIFQALKALNELRRHFAHHPGRVTLTMSRVDRVYGALPAQSKAWIRQLSKVDILGKKSRNPAHDRFVYVALALIDVIDRAIGSVISSGAFSGIRTD